MPNKRIDELPAATAIAGTDLMFIGNPSTGALNKAQALLFLFGGASVKTTTYAPTRTFGIEAIVCDTSGGAFSVNLPTAVGNYAIFLVKKITSSANGATIDGDGTETIDGATTITITTENEAVMLISDQSNWHIF